MLPVLLSLLFACNESDPAGAQAAKEGLPPARVEVAAARDGELDEAWTTLGEVVPLARSELAAGAAGPVERVPYREGDVVAEGAVLLEVSSAPAAARVQAAQADVARAEAELGQGRSDLSRLERVDARVLAAAELDAAQTRVAVLEAGAMAARAALAEAGVSLARHRVLAPFPGVVTARHLDPGDWVQVGTAAVDLVSAHAVEIRVDAAWELAGRLAPGDAATVLGDDRAVEADARVVAVVPVLDPATRTSRIRLAPADDPAPDWLRPGAPVEVRFAVVALGAGVVVPRDALVLAPGSAKIVKVDPDGNAVHVDVVVVASGEHDALVQAADLQPGDQVVTRGNERVRSGQPLLVGAAE